MARLPMAHASWITSLFRSRLQLGFLLVAAAFLIAFGFLPLFAGPGYEAALAAGLLLPSIAAVATALDVTRQRPAPFEALSRGIARGGCYALVALLVALLHGMRAAFCDPANDTALLVLGGCFGAVMGGAWGSAAGLVAGALPRWRRTAAVAGALLGPLGGIGISLCRFYTSPMVFAYDPFFGLFAGPLYDTVVDRLARLASYRIGSTLTLLAATVAALQLDRNADGRIILRRPRRPGVLVLGGLAAAGSLATVAYGHELGHFSTTASIQVALGRQVDSAQCRVIYSSAISERDARLVAEQCDAHLKELAGYFEITESVRPTVYLFASASEKGRLMGAARTEVAKPWRREVYIQQGSYPHRVLRHELAHVVAGSFGVGPFRVSGPLAGLIPDPGRIEGVAVAAAPGDDADLTLQQWARTMLDLELLPDLQRVFRLSFLGENSSKAYAVAGAFVQWFHRRYGSEALRRWYGGTDLGELTGGKGLAELEGEWRASLKAVAVAPEARHAARARFDRPAIFGRRCPRVVDRLAGEASSLLSGRDHLGARQAYQQLLELDAHHTGARLGLGTCALRAGNEAEARQHYGQVANDTSVTRLKRAEAQELVVDLEFAAGRVEKAVRGYREVEKVAIDADHLRALGLKQSASDELSRSAVGALLIGDPRFGTSWGITAALLGEWAAKDPEQGTASYLLGRNFFNHGRWQQAARYLDEALEREIPQARVRREAARMRAVLACARGRRARARKAYQRYLQEQGASPARRAGMHRFAVRCGIAQP